MKDFGIQALRASMLSTLLILALLALAGTTITVVNVVGSGEVADRTVGAGANQNMSAFAAPDPDQQAVEMEEGSAWAGSEPETWLLMIFGLGAVSFVLRRRKFDRIRYQFS